MVSAAFEEAVRLGSGHAGPEHFLLALLRPDQHTLAAAVLRGCGADYDRLSSVLARAAAERPVEGDAGVTLNPVAHELIGRAEGLAAGLGAEEVEPEHLLLALVWAAQRDWPLAAAGTTREAVYEQLRAHGVGLAVPLPPSRPRPEGAEQCVYFPQVQHTISGAFLTYWQKYGGLRQFGYPITEPLLELSDIDGKTYSVQYFERARFELHPEYAGTEAEVLLGLLGLDISPCRD